MSKSQQTEISKKVAAAADQIVRPPALRVPPVHVLAMLDPESDLFMKVAQHAYSQHLDELVPCKVCGRKFFPDRILRHESNCAAAPKGKKHEANLKKGSGGSLNYEKVVSRKALPSQGTSSANTVKKDKSHFVTYKNSTQRKNCN